MYARLYERCLRFVTAFAVRTDRKSKLRTESVWLYWTCVEENCEVRGTDNFFYIFRPKWRLLCLLSSLSNSHASIRNNSRRMQIKNFICQIKEASFLNTNHPTIHLITSLKQKEMVGYYNFL